MFKGFVGIGFEILHFEVLRNTEYLEFNYYESRYSYKPSTSHVRKYPHRLSRPTIT